MFGITEYKFDNRKWDIKNSYCNVTVTSKYASHCFARNKSKENERVLIKKIACDKDNEVIKAYKEVVLLKRIIHENVVELLDAYTKAKSLVDFKELYIVLPHMDGTLRDVIHTQKLTTEHIRFITYQILRGLKYLHSMSITLKNLKPNSIALNENLELRIQEFNFSADEIDDCSCISRSYKAPEVLLKCDDANETADMWSLGCILLECYTNEALFVAKNVSEQLSLIFEIIPEASKMQEIYSKRMKSSTEDSKNEKKKKRHEINSVISKFDQDASDLIKNYLLKTDPGLRYSSKQALEEALFVSEYHDADDEPEGEHVEILDKADKMNIMTLKSMLYQEISSDLI